MDFSQVFGSVTNFHTVFMEGLDKALANEDLGAATFNLVFGNAILHHKEREFLERLEAAKGKLAAKIDPGATDDDSVIFRQLKDMKLDWQNWTMVEDRKVNSWNIQLNKFRILKPKGFSEKIMTKVHEPFDEGDFNFNKIKDPTIWKGEVFGRQLSLYYNKFPYKDLQALVVLDSAKNMAQLLTEEAHLFIWNLTRTLKHLYNVSLGYNSLGASASVNHLHFHLMVGIEKLTVVEQKWKHNGGEEIYPANVYSFDKADEAWVMIEKLNNKNIAYNVLYLPDKAYIFPRKFMGTFPEAPWSVGFGWYQFSGNFIVYDEEIANSLTDRVIKQSLTNATISLQNESMGKFVKAAKLSQINEGRPFCAQIEGKSIAIYKIGGKIYATTGICTHAGGPLCEGELSGGVVTCPWHGSKYDVTDGKVIHGPSQDPIKTYQTRVNGEDLEIELI